MNSARSNIKSFECERFTPSGCKDFVMRKLDFDANNFLFLMRFEHFDELVTSINFLLNSLK